MEESDAAFRVPITSLTITRIKPETGSKAILVLSSTDC